MEKIVTPATCPKQEQCGVCFSPLDDLGRCTDPGTHATYAGPRAKAKTRAKAEAPIPYTVAPIAEPIPQWGSPATTATTPTLPTTIAPIEPPIPLVAPPEVHGPKMVIRPTLLELGLSPGAIVLHLELLAWSCRQLLDGEIPAATANRWVRTRTERRRADELVKAGLWRRGPDGSITLTTFLADGNPKAERIRAWRRRKADEKAVQRAVWPPKRSTSPAEPEEAFRGPQKY